MPDLANDAGVTKETSVFGTQTNVRPLQTAAVQAPITQREMREYYELAEQERQIEQRREALRASLIDRMLRGAGLEHGRYRLKLDPRFPRHLSEKNLLPILGRAGVEELKKQITPAISFYLKAICH